MVYSKPTTFIYLFTADGAFVILLFEKRFILLYANSVALTQITPPFIVVLAIPAPHRRLDLFSVGCISSNKRFVIILRILSPHTILAPRSLAVFTGRMIPILIKRLRLATFCANLGDYLHIDSIHENYTTNLKLNGLVSICLFKRSTTELIPRRFLVERDEGFEPPTSALEGACKQTSQANF